MSKPKNHRTTNGLGSIRKKKYKRADGTYQEFYEARFTTAWEDGKQIQKSVYGKTKADVVEKMKAYNLPAQIKEPAQITIDKITVEDWLVTWSADYLISVKPSTAFVYKTDIENYLIPSLGKIKISNLSVRDIQSFYNELLKPAGNGNPLSSKTVRCIHGVLHQALEQAVKNGIITVNPSSACVLPKIEKHEIKPMDDAELLTFFDLIDGHPHELFYKIAIFTGMREGELLGLTWDCIDFKKSTVTVKQQLQKERGKGGKYILCPTKNGKIRTLTIAPSVRGLFYLQKRNQEKMRTSSSWNEAGFVFTNKDGERLSYRTVYDCFKRFVKKMNRADLKVHSLRHQFAVISIKNNDSIKTIQENLGHSSASFTMDVYGHITEQIKKESANKMENYINSLYKTQQG